MLALSDVLRGSVMEECVPALPDVLGGLGVEGVPALLDVVDGSGSEGLVPGLGDRPCGDIH